MYALELTRAVKIVNLLDCVRRKQSLREFSEIQPLVGSPLQGAVIEIESIDINVYDRHCPLLNSRP